MSETNGHTTSYDTPGLLRQFAAATARTLQDAFAPWQLAAAPQPPRHPRLQARADLRRLQAVLRAPRPGASPDSRLPRSHLEPATDRPGRRSGRRGDPLRGRLAVARHAPGGLRQARAHRRPRQPGAVQRAPPRLARAARPGDAGADRYAVRMTCSFWRRTARSLPRSTPSRRTRPRRCSASRRATRSISTAAPRRHSRTLPRKVGFVHASRVLHVAEDCLDDDVYGIPRLKPVFDRLDDLLKVVGGSAEFFLRGASRLIGLEGRDDYHAAARAMRMRLRKPSRNFSIA